MGKRNHSFQQKLEALTQQMSPEHRERTADNIQLLLDSAITSFKALLECVNEDSKPLEARVTACWVLPRLKPTAHQREEIADTLLSVVNQKNEPLQHQAIIGLGDLNAVSQRVIETLEMLMVTHSSAQIREAAAYAYGRVAQPGKLEVLTSVITNPGEAVSVRGMAIEAVSNIGDRPFVPVLIDMLSDPSAEVRFWSAFSLGVPGAEDAIPALTWLMNNDHEMVTGWGSVSDEEASAIERYQMEQ